jgi:ABC-2 type transport system ATP-binding protein
MSVGMIEVHDLQKTFKGDVQALKGVSLSVAKGEFFAFLGPNGAGKSTTIQILTTLISPTSGRALVSGYDVLTQPEQARLEIGVALQETGIDPALTGRELLEIQARHFGMSSAAAKKRAVELLEKINLTEDANRRCGNYSGGMRRRLDLALSLVHRPNILFLDEPTTGLDPVNRIAIWEEIRDLNQQLGTTIFLTTQYLEEADQLAERISIIDKGQIVISGTPKELKRRIGMDVIEMQFADEVAATRGAQLLAGLCKQHTQQREIVKCYVEDGTRRLPEFVRTLDAESLHILTLNLAPPTLDDVFIQVTGKKEATV